MIAIFWLGLVVLLVAVLALDLGVFHRDARAQTVGEAALWSVVWIGTALVFNVFVFAAYENHLLGIGVEAGPDVDGRQAAVEFLTAYLLEKSLSLDNIMVIAMVFTYFAIPLESQHRVLFWGVLGALVMRAVFIVCGLAVVERFAWTTYVFGAFLLFTAVKMLVERHDNLQPERNALVRALERRLPVTDEIRGGAFFVRRRGGGWAATPLFLALLVVETSDLLFAVDSVPAVIAVTRDPFLAFSSNAFAILGLRSLYFVIAPLIGKFKYLKMSLIFVLAFVGIKMLLAHHSPLPTTLSLGFILGILGVGVAASWVSGGEPVTEPSPVELQREQLVRMSLVAARRIVLALIVATLLLVGVAMVVLPGPGLEALPFGALALAAEVVWAHRWLARVRERANGAVGSAAAVPRS